MNVPAGTKGSESTERCLVAEGIDVQFAGVHALGAVDLRLRAGEILGLIGPNGAGKSTLVNVLTGFQSPTVGDVWIGGRKVTRWSPNRRARAGLGRTFQAVRLFLGVSVRENIEIGALGCGISAKESAQRADALIEQADFHRWADVEARNLPHGVAHYAGILRALANNPEYLLLDEPAAGMHEEDTEALKEFLKAIQHERKCGILLIEHDVQFVMSTCDFVQVLNYGKSIALGTPAEVKSDPRVKEAYLGAGG